MRLKAGVPLPVIAANTDTSMKETKSKQQVDDQAKQLTQESAALKNKERMYKIIGAPWPPRYISRNNS